MLDVVTFGVVTTRSTAKRTRRSKCVNVRLMLVTKPPHSITTLNGVSDRALGARLAFQVECEKPEG